MIRQKRLRLIRQSRKAPESIDSVVPGEESPIDGPPIPRSKRYFSWTKVFENPKPVHRFGEGRAWGGWATSGFGLIIGVIYFSVIFLTILGFILSSLKDSSASSFQELVISVIRHQYISIVAVGTITTFTVCIPLIWLFMKVRPNISIANYLGLRKVRMKTVLAWLAITLVFVVLLHTFLFVIKQPGNQLDIVLESTNLPLIFWIAAIVFAPLFEETFFRGFLFKGFWQSRLGIIPTILLMSITWTSLHYEYGILSMVMLFIFGICLGIARYKTNSLLPPLLMHAFWNAIALSSTFVFG